MARPWRWNWAAAPPSPPAGLCLGECRLEISDVLPEPLVFCLEGALLLRQRLIVLLGERQARLHYLRIRSC